MANTHGMVGVEISMQALWPHVLSVSVTIEVPAVIESPTPHTLKTGALKLTMGYASKNVVPIVKEAARFVTPSVPEEI